MAHLPVPKLMEIIGWQGEPVADPHRRSGHRPFPDGVTIRIVRAESRERFWTRDR